MKYIVIELQTSGDSVANIVTSFDTLAQAESKYHSVLAAAAVSQLDAHSASLLTSDGYCMEYRCYHKEVEAGE